MLKIETMMMLMIMILLSAVFVVDDGRINFADFCKLMKQQKQAPGDEMRLPEQDTRHVFRVSIRLFIMQLSSFKIQ